MSPRSRTVGHSLVRGWKEDSVILLKRERLRRKYRPLKVKVLFVGESPPASGRFFYQADSGLYRAMRNVFAACFPSMPKDGFLRFFQAGGCYLIDLCAVPVDHLEKNLRTQICSHGEERLTRRLRKFQPDVVVSLLRSISQNVTRAQKAADWRGIRLDVSYPGRWDRHRKRFRRIVVPILRKYVELPPVD